MLNWQRSLWEGDEEVVKRSCRDEPMWVIIQVCIEAMLGISLYSYLYLKLPQMLCYSYYLLCFLFNKIREKEGQTGSDWKQGKEVRREGGRWPGSEGQKPHFLSYM
jgi:hypothetical protein